ncbi:uncharacterized protein [Antedon mediterranea]|uniref:uncharacterized protein isoform X1 n=1 Tax=Antedon mediterranea TaxID=105859 RepID=UPI003AF6E58B
MDIQLTSCEKWRTCPTSTTETSPQLNTSNGEELSCHLTWTDLKKIKIKHFETEIQLLSSRNVNYNELPTYYLSINNLLAYVLYTAGQTQLSVSVWEEILARDSGNYNAISNLAVIYFRQSKLSKYREYRNALMRIMQVDDTKAKVRAMIDKAHAIRHFQQDKRDFTYMDILIKSAELAESVTCIPERAEWLFDYGLALYRKDAQLTSTGAKPSETYHYFKNAVSYFNKVIRVQNGPLNYKALSWIFISILLRHVKGRTLCEVVDDEDMRNMTAQDCLEQALKVNSDDRIVQRRAASEYIYLKRYSEALCLLDDSLKQEESWFAYRYRGLLRLEMFKDKDYITDTVQKRQILLDAKNDFEQAINLKEVHADHSDLGYTLYLLGDYNLAINQFVAAVNCEQNDNFDPSITYCRWAECLYAIDEPEGALRQLHLHKQTRSQLNRSTITLAEAFQSSRYERCNGIDCDISQFKFCLSYVPGYVNVLSEMTLPSPPISHQNQTLNKTYKYDFFVSFCHDDYKWCLEFIRKLEKDFKMRCCVRYRDYDAEESMATDVTNAIQNSFKIITIISPESVKDKLWQFELMKSMEQMITRSCIAPIILRQACVPREIEHLSNIRLFRGQFLKEDWSRLERFLKG